WGLRRAGIALSEEKGRQEWGTTPPQASEARASRRLAGKGFFSTCRRAPQMRKLSLVPPLSLLSLSLVLVLSLSVSGLRRGTCGYEIGGGGIRLHWPALDEYLSIAGLVAGVDLRSA